MQNYLINATKQYVLLKKNKLLRAYLTKLKKPQPDILIVKTKEN